MTVSKLINFIEKQGVVVESAKGHIPNLADMIAGETIRGSWWGHPKGNLINNLLGKVRESDEILVCRFINGKITFIHKRLWSSFVKLAPNIDSVLLDKVMEVHTPSGKHKVETIPFPNWVPDDVLKEAEKLREDEAIKMLPKVILKYHRPIGIKTRTKEEVSAKVDQVLDKENRLEAESKEDSQQETQRSSKE